MDFSSRLLHIATYSWSQNGHLWGFVIVKLLGILTFNNRVT